MSHYPRAGSQLEDHVQLRRVDPAAYRVFFHDETAGPSWLDLLYDVQAMAAQLEAVEAGAAAAYLRFLANAKVGCRYLWSIMFTTLLLCSSVA